MESVVSQGVGRRRLLGWGALVAGGLVGAGRATAAPDPEVPDQVPPDRVPPDTRPGGAYDQYVARLAAEDRFSGVVMLAHRGRTVLSRCYGLADRERGIRNHENVAFALSSGSQPFLAVAVLQLAQQGKLALSDTVGKHLTGLPQDVAEQVTIHHLLTPLSGLDAPEPDWARVFHSTEEVHAHQEWWTRQARLVAAPGTGDNSHRPGGGSALAIAARIVEAASGKTFWDYVHENVFARAGMTGSAYFTRPRWLTDPRIAHPYLRLPDGSRVDAVRNLDMGERNPGRAFIGHASGDGFATAPDLVRFATALRDGTLLSRPYADLFACPKIPGYDPTSFESYTMPVSIVGDQWMIGRGGVTGGCAANWTIYPDTGWVGVVLSNYDDIDLLGICLQEIKAVTGVTLDPPGGGR